MNKNKTSFITLAFAALVTLTAQGCATTEFRSKDSVPEEIVSQDVEYTIKKGDRLGDIANAITGKVSLWKEIAAFNQITDPRTLRVGDVITVPASLIPVAQNAAADEQKSVSKKQSIAAASNSSAQSGIAATSALAVVQSNTRPDDKPADVVIQPVTINRTFELNPIDESDLARTAQSGQEVSSPRVKVIGSYYPKGVYEEPASYATLMMRVAPGTVFELDREVNDWYKVVTKEGVGYLRIVDGVIVNN